MLKRKATAVFTAFLTAFSTLSPQLPALHADAADTYAGDVNLDGAVNTSDIQLLQAYLLSASPLTANQKKAGDMNEDGSLNVLDLSLLKGQMLQIIGAEQYSGLMINEVCTSNKESVADAAGASPDWIELYNGSDRAISLDGIGVSDGAKNKFKFVFPEGTTIPAGQYILIYCDDAVNQAEGEYHAAFKISATGETIYLTHPQYGEIDSVAVPELDTDVCYGRYANGSENFTYLSYTPGYSNDEATELNLVEKPVFSVEGGFYDTAFELALTDNNGNAIYYTTDGSDPITSDTAKLYSGEISIYNNTSDPNVWSAVRDISLYGYTPPSSKVDKGMIIRAVSRTTDGRYSAVATNSYFIGKTASYYSDMKVISLSTDPDYFFDEDTGAYMVGSGYYEWKNSSEYVERDPGDTKNPANYNMDGLDSEFPVNIQVFENGKLEYTSDVGARIAGNWTRAMPQKSIRLYARSEYGDSKMKYTFFDELTDESGNPIEKFDKITLNNGGNDCPYLHFRDALIQEVTAAGDLSLDYMATEPCILFIDGEFWGFYLMREKVDADYIESHYEIDKDDIVVIKNGAIEDGPESEVNAFNDFCNWASSADLTDPANYQKVCDTFDIESFMDYIAVETYINNSDWAPDYLNNWIIWKTSTANPDIPEADGKWRFVLYDTDGSAGLYKNAATSASHDLLNNMYREAHWCNYLAIFYNLMNNQDFRDCFYDNYIEVMETCFDADAVNAVIDQYEAAYKEAAVATHNRFNLHWIKSYDDELNNLRAFFNTRPAYAKYYLDKFYGLNPSDDDLLPDVNEWTYYGSADFYADPVNKSFTAATYELGTNIWDSQSQALGISLVNGKTYLLTFEASCTVDTDMYINILHYYNSEYPSCWGAAASLTSEMQKFSYVFTMEDMTANDWYLAFNYGGAVGEYTIQNARLVEVQNLVTNASSWSLYDVNNSSTLEVTDAGSITVNVNTLPANTYDVQVANTGIGILAGETYTYMFTVESTAETQIKAKIEQNYGDYVNYSEAFPETGPEPSVWTVTFTAAEDCSDTKLCFNLGYAVGTYSIRNIILVRHS